MANNNHVTKADLKALRDELIEAIRDVETKLLKAFYGFAESTQERISNNEGATDGLKNRLATLERRITDLEKRVNFPHAS